MKIALVSLNQIWEDKKANLNLCENYIQKAFNKNDELVIFPEMTLTGYSNNIDFISEDFQNSWTISIFSKLAKKFNIAIIFGVVIKNEKKVYNKVVFIDNKGNLLGNYDKIHPFSFAKEDKFFDSGNKLEIIDYKNIKFGLTICYDLRFPELYSLETYQKSCV
jgi:omega-amidase